MEDLLGTTPATETSAQEVPQPPSNEAPPSEEPSDSPEQDDPDAAPEPEFEEVDYSGRKFSVPKELAPIIAKAENLEAGVTKRFQEAAELRKQSEALIQSVQREQEINQHLVKEISQLTAVEERLNQFSQVDWQGWQAQNPQAANAALAEMMQLQEAHRTLRGTVETRRAEIGASQNERAQTLISQAVEALNKPDPDKGWAGKFDETTRKDLTKFGKEIGYTDAELANTTHPLMIKTLNLARIGYEALQKQKASIKAPKPTAEPVPQIVPGKTRTVADPEKMSMAEYTKWREAQIARNRAR